MLGRGTQFTTIRVPATAAGPELVLRPWVAEDAAALVDVYRDPAIRHWIRVAVRDVDQAAAWVAAQQEGWRTGERLCFAVLDGTELVACVVLKKPRTRPEVGYWTAAAARGRGVASRAVDALSTWAFATFRATRLELRHQVDNLASCRVAQKTGFDLHSTILAAAPYPLDGHLHVRHAPA
ncbi:GNAT family N-acetyltransferase [Actinophytocola oryzae]|uniref:RimJ/RimL family protein N-acetyltransferase n=1 Tax=Actinophytocola oryzae TaxID=502181 RepID=A0A4R7VWY4_9PSEU|nr:GNAT family N-acetyltransferase [Actinophytocola oryzae]TDV54158.1 RimJ/RimL family protein N-acetyltransferase [Actinophytocola oryzae]